MKRFINNFRPSNPPPSISQSAFRNPRSAIAFTLIEVMIAVAVVTLGIVAVLGLIPVGLKSARDAADNTLSATIVQDVFSVIRAQPFNSLGAPNTLYFDQNGTNMTPVTTPYYSYYRVEVSYTSLSPLPLYGIQATVVWPAWTASPLNTNIFVTEVAWYDNP